MFILKSFPWVISAAILILYILWIYYLVPYIRLCKVLVEMLPKQVDDFCRELVLIVIQRNFSLHLAFVNGFALLFWSSLRPASAWAPSCQSPPPPALTLFLSMTAKYRCAENFECHHSQNLSSVLVKSLLRTIYCIPDILCELLPVPKYNIKEGTCALLRGNEVFF